jgi:CheY-like chemotaxis protein
MKIGFSGYRSVDSANDFLIMQRFASLVLSFSIQGKLIITAVRNGGLSLSRTYSKSCMAAKCKALQLLPHLVRLSSSKGKMQDRVPTILCIDDDSETLALRQHFLQSSGYSVVTASSGVEGLRALSEGQGIDLVLLDYMMPGMDGDEVVQELKKQHPRLPVVVVSAVAQLPQGLLTAIDGYVQKGQDPDVLLGTVLKILTSRSGEGAPMESSNLGRKTVLCAEDDEEQLTSRKMVFESAGFDVLLARSGAEALQLFQAHSVDAVVLDYWMPRMKGLSVAREMKQLRPNIPILVLSGFSSLPDETIGIVDTWLQKRDVEPGELLAEVNRLMEKNATG